MFLVNTTVGKPRLYLTVLVSSVIVIISLINQYTNGSHSTYALETSYFLNQAVVKAFLGFPILY